MKIDERAFKAGFDSGLSRASSAIPQEFDKSLVTAQLPTIRAVLERAPSDAHPRFIALVVELWVVAVAARLAYKESPLQENEIKIYLDQTSSFLNSFFHK